MLVLSLAACLGLQTLPEKQTGTHDSGQPVAVGGLEVSASAVDFGQVDLDATASEPLTLHNTGDGAISVSASITGSSRFQLDAASIEVAAARDEVLTVRFTPDMESTFEGTLTIQTDSGDSVDVALLGEGLEGGTGGDTDDSGGGPSHGDISVSSTSLSYGSVDVGDTLSRTVTVTNEGTADLVIDPATTSAAAFSVSGDFTTSRTLAPGASKTLQVDFHPSGTGSYNAYVELMSDDPDEASTRINLEGEAVDSCDICAPLISVDTGGADPYAIDDFFSLIGPDTRTITVQNIGDMDLTVSDVSVINDVLAPCGTFSLTGWSGSKTLSPYGTTSFQLSYDSSDICLDVAQDSFDMNVVHIRSNDPGEPDYVIALSGTGF